MNTQGKRPDQLTYSERIAAQWMVLFVCAVLVALMVGCGKDPATAPKTDRVCKRVPMTVVLRNAQGDSIAVYQTWWVKCS